MRNSAHYCHAGSVHYQAVGLMVTSGYSLTMGLLAGFAAVEIIQIAGNKIKESPELKLHQPRQARTEEAKSRHTPLSVTYVIVAESGRRAKVLKNSELTNAWRMPMAQPPYPPPPPPTPSSVKGGFHGPPTNLFPSVRARLTALEQHPQPVMSRKPNKGLLVALILGATLSIVLSLVVQLALGVGGIVFGVIVAPFTEEPFKALSVVIVALFVWKTIPNRWYGAALGTAAGLGFGIAESLLYIIGFLVSNATADQIALQVIARIIVTPLMHPVWSAIVGVGIFVLLAKKPADKGMPLGLALLVLVLGTIGHMMWNGVASGLLAYEILPVVLNIIIIFPIFAIILRDFLGGHFNFQSFFQPLPEPPSSQPPILLPPPPPPSP